MSGKSRVVNFLQRDLRQSFAKENSRELRQRTRALTEKLKSKMRAEELETLEHSVRAAVEHNKRLTTKQPVEFIKRSTASASLRVAI